MVRKKSAESIYTPEFCYFLPWKNMVPEKEVSMGGQNLIVLSNNIFVPGKVYSYVIAKRN